ncbi:MAG TPA: hypothetical protein VGX27_09530, partial [Candidatus Dormibacteraeota bacterium]|nr:hypothetical protein [Candidatus Dormibacteraeota bacterium]
TPYYTTAGDTAAQNSNINVSSTASTPDTGAIDWWMGAPFHAMAMLDPRLTTTGFGSFRYVKSGWQFGAALDVIRGNSFSGGTFPVFFPGNGSIEPLTAYSGNESPDPLAGCPGYTMPVGLPIFMEVGANVATSVGPVHTLTGNGVPLNHCIIASNTTSSLSSYLTERGGVIMVPETPLQSGVKYTVSLTVNGTPYTWSFTVGPFPARCATAGVTSSVSSPDMVGASVTFTASSSGCSTPLYEFWILAPGANLYTLAQAYSTNAAIVWKTSGLVPGTYRVNVWVRASSSPGTFNNAWGSWDTYDANLYFTLTAGCAGVSESASPAAGVMAGNSVSVTAVAGGCPNPLYEFWVLAPGASLYTLAQAYSTTSTLSWSTANLAPGLYRFDVWVKDSSSAGTYSNPWGSWDAYDASLYYTVSAGCPAVIDSASPAIAMAGAPVTINATAPGCGNPQFELWVLAPGASMYKLVQPYTSAAGLLWSTSGLSAGTYRMNVWVRSATSAGLYSNAWGSWDAYNASVYYTLTPGCPTVHETASPISGTVGTTITVTAAAPGCPNPQYEFWVLAPGAALYTLAQPYGSSGVFTWKTTGLAAGTYRITVWVRDASSPGISSNAWGTWDTYDGSLYVPLT